MRNAHVDRGSPYIERIPPREWAIIFGAWTLFGVAQILTQLFVSRPEMTYQATAWHAFGQYMPRLWLWAALTPLIESWDRILRARFTRLPIRISLHIPLYILCALAEAVVR